MTNATERVAQLEAMLDTAIELLNSAKADLDALRAKLDAGCPTCAAAVRMQRLIDDRQS